MPSGKKRKKKKMNTHKRKKRLRANRHKKKDRQFLKMGHKRPSNNHFRFNIIIYVKL